MDKLSRTEKDSGCKNTTDCKVEANDLLPPTIVQVGLIALARPSSVYKTSYYEY